MRKIIFVLICLVFPVLAQEELFGYEILKETLEPAVAAYIGREVWAYGNLDVYCQNPRDTRQVSRFYNTTPQLKLTIQNLVYIRLSENYWQQIIHVNGGFTQPGDHSGVSSETAFLLVLQTETPIENDGAATSGTPASYGAIVEEKCQQFFTVVLPELNALERVFSFESIQDVAKKNSWPKKSLYEVLDATMPVQAGMTKEMVLWKLGAPRRPLDLTDAFNAGYWGYLDYVPFSKDVTFDKKTGTMIKYIEGRLP